MLSCPEVWIPVTKGISQALVEHLTAHLQHKMCTFLCPLHLLLFGKSLTYDLVYRRFHKARRNRLVIAPTFAVVS
jgi:predicted Kef-type K+ transport protein